MFVTDFRMKLVHGKIDLFSWIKMTTSAFARLFQSSAAVIIHQDRHTYFINEADFSHGQFMKDDYVGTKDLGWGRFEKLFSEELEKNEGSQLGDFQITMPAKGICIPNLNSSKVLIFDRQGEIVQTQIDQEKIDDLVFDRAFQAKGSLMVVPIVARSAGEARRAMVYLYSPEGDHFELPLAGYAAFLLAGAAAPAFDRLL
jgi:hypothetical protein